MVYTMRTLTSPFLALVCYWYLHKECSQVGLKWSHIKISFTSWYGGTNKDYFSSVESSTLAITCSTIEARRPNARPHSSPRVTTALPSFTTILLACFSSLRWAKDFPWARLRGTVIKGMLLQERTCLMAECWPQSVIPKVKYKKNTIWFLYEKIHVQY